MRQFLPLFLLVPGFFSPACPALAQSGASELPPWRIGMAAGYGERSNPLVNSEDIPVVLDLDIAWFGDRWFFDNGDAGLTFAATPVATVSAVGRINSDRVFFGRTETRFFTSDVHGFAVAEPIPFEPPDRDYAVELGIEMLSDGAWGSLQLTAYADASNTHDGYELAVDYGYGWRRQRLYLEPSLGLSYKSADLNNYYWGVTSEETANVIPAYEAGAGINSHVRIMFGYQFTSRVGFSIVAEYEQLSSAAAGSPIVDEDAVVGWFAGTTWRF